METQFPYMTFIMACKTCRKALVADTLQGISEDHCNVEDLYDALYSEADSEIFQIKLELYELEWVAKHWNDAAERIRQENLTSQEKKNILARFAEYFTSFLSHWNYSAFDALIFDEKESILRAIISANSNWEQNLKKMEVSFTKSKKLLKAKLKEYEKDGMTHGSRNCTQNFGDV